MTMPQRLGKYPITAVIGKGSMGVVYRGIDPVIKRPVAIKTIRRELVEEDENGQSTSERFRREAQAAGALHHPGIVSVYEYGEDEHLAYIAMELVEGDSLRDYLARGVTFNEHDTVSLMAQLLDALQFAHDNAVWHRDIKPANIVVMGNGRIKLTDFGIARIETTDFTKTNVVMGTPGFIAPEIYLGRDIDQRVDIFAAGVLFYQLLSGRPPYQGRPEAVMHDVCYHDPPPPSSVDPQHSWPQYDAVAAHALAKVPAQRFASAAAFRAAILAEFAQPLDSTLSDATVVGGTRSGRFPALAPLPGAAATSTYALTGAGFSTPPPTGWSVSVLAGVEVELARFLGPVAKVLVRRAARAHKDVGGLVAAVVDHIDAAADRDAFCRAVTGSGLATLRSQVSGGSETPVPAAPHDGPPVSSADLEQMTRLLTPVIGPIARVVVKRAAALGGTRRDVLNRVAQSLDDEGARERLMRMAAQTIG